jgi:hypothetical protein
MTIIAMFMVLAMLGSAIAAAWPLLLLPRFRPALLGTTGSSCLATGAALFGLAVSGVLPLPGMAGQALAADNTPAKTADDSAPGSGSDVTAPAAKPAELPESESSKPADNDHSKSVADPVIESAKETVVIPPGRPAWVEKEPGQSGEIYSIAVASGPYAHETEARRHLDRELEKVTNEYIAEYLGSSLAPRFVSYDARTIMERFVKPENKYNDVATYSVGPMYEHFALVEFDKAFRSKLDERWEAVRGKSRLMQMALFAGAGLLLLSSVFGYFRLDNATRGYYTGRLQFMTAAAILAVVGAGALAAQWITWL